jgi:hypothetical protein
MAACLSENHSSLKMSYNNTNSESVNVADIMRTIMDFINNKRTTQKGAKRKSFPGMECKELFGMPMFSSLHDIDPCFPTKGVLITIATSMHKEEGFVAFEYIMGFLIRLLDEKEEIINKLIQERNYFYQQCQELKTELFRMQSQPSTPTTTTQSETQDNLLIGLDEIKDDPNYICHYVAYHKDFISQVMVVAWKSPIPGPTFCHENKFPVLYVYHRNNQSHGTHEGSHTAGTAVDYSDEEVKKSKKINVIIAKHQQQWFERHSNLVAIRASVSGCVEFVVTCRNFIPIGDDEPLPEHVDDIKTCVCAGWFELCGRKERMYCRPLLPGAGFGVGASAFLQFTENESDYVEPFMGTIGGWYVDPNNQTIYAVTCGHCIQDTNRSMYPQNTEVYQPCAMGMVIEATLFDPNLLDTYDRMKDDPKYVDNYCRKSNKSYDGGTRQFAMNHLKKTIGEEGEPFNVKVESDFACGTVVAGGGSFQIGTTTMNIDLGLIRLNVAVCDTCTKDNDPSNPQSPNLILGQGGTSILKHTDFPRHPFLVYGQGAKSPGLMRAVVNLLTCETYVREIYISGVVYHCICAKVLNGNWTKGDSGTWCWTEDGKLVGMGIGQLYDEVYILPMSDVECAIQSILLSNEAHDAPLPAAPVASPTATADLAITTVVPDPPPDVLQKPKEDFISGGGGGGD